MNNLDLRPLSLGEVLDRTFTLYRSHFLLFLGLAGIPQVLPLALNLAMNLSGGLLLAQIGFALLFVLASVVAYLYSQGGAVIAVSKLYLGRPTTIAESFREVTSHLGFLFGVILLSFLAVGVGFIFLIGPGIYLLCRLLVSIPSALIEQRGPIESLQRSWELTRHHAGRAFLIVLLYLVLAYGLLAVITVPLALVVAFAPQWTLLATVVSTVLTTIATSLVTPVFLIATSVFYYDLRVRKEAFDLQIMMDPDSAHVARANLRTIVPE